MVQTTMDPEPTPAAVEVTSDAKYAVNDVEEQTVARPSNKKRILLALVAGLLVVGGVVGAILVVNAKTNAPASSTSVSVGATRAFQGLSVAYDSNANPNGIKDDFQRIKQRFGAVRTFQTAGTRNHIQAAGEVGIGIYAGVWIRGSDADTSTDMQAVVTGVKSYPNNVKAVFVGNEDLSNGVDPSVVIAKVQQMKQLLRNAGFPNIPIGSVQTDGAWNGNGRNLANNCDILGVNIHPFFSGAVSRTQPIEDLKSRWNQMVNWFPGKKIILATTKDYLNKVQDWAKQGNGGDMPAFFVYNDTPYKSPDFEQHFGLSSNGVWKFDFSFSPSPVPSPPSPTPKPSSQPALGPKQKGAFTNSNNGAPVVLAAVNGNDATESHLHWGDKDWVYDGYGLWTIQGNQIANVVTNTCLDAYQPQNGGIVHMVNCDTNNGNQQWRYDGSTRQLRHLTHSGYCLDLNSPTKARPYLWQC
ncbi:hypothetical protein AeMF1_017321 [Aphanomyces euteiches]|nr:hypothetical protein AeMF1_017321 [Aphanomyces euteiches]